MTIHIQRVQPGDLISATYFNEVVGHIEALDGRLAALENAPAPGSGPVVITGAIPSPVRVGDDVTITGQNFGFSVGAHRVRFNGVLTTHTRSGSTDSRLVCVVPPLDGLQAQGSPVQLSVSNATSTATRTITVLPFVVPQSGNLDLLFRGTDPDIVTAGAPSDFEFRLESDAAQPATVSITPRITVNGSPVSWTTTVLDAAKTAIANRQITVAPGEAKSFYVRVAVPAGTNNTPFTFTVEGAGPLATSSGAMPFTVGQSGDPDPNITLSPSASPDLSGARISVARGGFAEIAVETHYAAAGTYRVTLEELPDTKKWGYSLTAPPREDPRVTVIDSQVAGGRQHSSPIEFNVGPLEGATAGQLRLTVKRTDLQRGRSFTFDLHVKN